MKRAMLAVMALGGLSAAQADTVWNESVNGDFSNNGLAPTVVTLTSPINSIFGTTGNDGSGIDRDYFSFIVPEGMTLTGILMRDTTVVSGGSGFIGVQAGSQLTVTPTGGGAENLIGYMHYTNDQVGQNLLPDLIFGPVNQLERGTYSWWVQEIGGPATYGFDFVLTPVPLPAAAWLLLSGLLGIGALRRRVNEQ